MRFSKQFIALAAIYLTGANALPDEDEVASSPSVEIAKPSFTPTNLKADFLEQFTDDWEKRWVKSSAKKDDESAEEEWAYVGTWSVEEPETLKGIEGDKGLVLKDKAAHHAISAKFPKKIDNKNKDLVVQYEVKLQDGLQCGGAYMKLLQENKALHAEQFSNAAPYIIMFGPDKCGTTNKVHFILKHKNPKTGEYEEKHMTDNPRVPDDKQSHLYGLVLKSDNTFQIQIDGESKRNGSLLEDMSPPINPPKEIDDPKDKKPKDWVEEAKIPDPEAKKPEDWDEDAPFQIVDEEATKPEDWLEDEPKMVPDPEAEKPEDWDDEEDGDFAAPMIANPKCSDVSGCGPWEKPLIKNPEYKGKWNAPLVDNPEYKGVWKPRKIANPDYFEDKKPANLEAMGAIGFELWTMQANILFDNIYIGHSIDDAIAFKKETFDIKSETETAQAKAEEAEKQKFEDAETPGATGSFMDDPVNFIKTKASQFALIAQKDPLAAIQLMPEVAGAAGVLLVTILALLIGGIGGASQSPKVQEGAKKAADKAAEAKDKAADAASTGAEKVQAEVNKRSTRSSAAHES